MGYVEFCTSTASNGSHVAPSRHLLSFLLNSERFKIAEMVIGRYITSSCYPRQQRYREAKLMPQRWQFNRVGLYRWCSHLTNASDVWRRRQHRGHFWPLSVLYIGYGHAGQLEFDFCSTRFPLSVL